MGSYFVAFETEGLPFLSFWDVHFAIDCMFGRSVWVYNPKLAFTWC